MSGLVDRTSGSGANTSYNENGHSQNPTYLSMMHQTVLPRTGLPTHEAGRVYNEPDLWWLCWFPLTVLEVSTIFFLSCTEYTGPNNSLVTQIYHPVTVEILDLVYFMRCIYGLLNLLSLDIFVHNMMVSCHGNPFSITGPLWGDPPVTGGFALQRTSDADYDVFGVNC